MKPEINHFNYLLFCFILLLCLTGGCKKDDSESQIEIIIGADYQGGVVFYIDEPNKHGLIAATIDQSISASWWNGTYIATGSSSLTDGAANTTIIVQTQGNSGSYAAKLCRDYKGGGYNDWYLPSKEQLNILYAQKAVVGGFSSQIYWSSTEYNNGPESSVWVQDFETGEQHLDSKSDAANVHTRAIRSF